MQTSFIHVHMNELSGHYKYFLLFYCYYNSVSWLYHTH